jgi:sugar-specific transcriptional regulator TrmB
MSMQKAIDSLRHFGFTALESEIYAFLLTENPASGYRIAQALRKPAANVYKGIETLEQKGAIALQSGSKKTYIPTDPTKLIARLEKDFEKQRTNALKSLTSLGKLTVAGATTTVLSDDQAIATAKNLLATAQDVAIIICSDEYVSALSGLLAKAWVMSPTAVACANHIPVPVEAFEAPTLQVVVDRASAIFAVGGQGFAVEDNPLGAILHQAVVCQMGLFQVDRALEADAGRKQISRLIENLP